MLVAAAAADAHDRRLYHGSVSTVTSRRPRPSVGLLPPGDGRGLVYVDRLTGSNPPAADPRRPHAGGWWPSGSRRVIVGPLLTWACGRCRALDVSRGGGAAPGFRYWSRMSRRFSRPAQDGPRHRRPRHAGALLCAILPLGYALARLAVPGRTLVLLAFLLPQAFPQLPVFAAATASSILGLAGTVPGKCARAPGRGLGVRCLDDDGRFRAIDPASTRRRTTLALGRGPS